MAGWPCCFRACGKALYHGGVCGGAKLLTSWWLGSKMGKGIEEMEVSQSSSGVCPCGLQTSL